MKLKAGILNMIFLDKPSSPSAKNNKEEMGKAHPETTTPQQPDDWRCNCGKLIAKITPQGIEIQCARCKHLHVFPVMVPGQ
jgi:hypothetical protein